MVTEWHLAEINIARAMTPIDDPKMVDFVNDLDRINALAEQSPGFVWRLKSESADLDDLAMGDDAQTIMNMSVWQSVEALFDYVYRSDHKKVMARRREWFEKPTLAHQALWWIPAGHVPTVDEGLARLAILDRRGPTTAAFIFKQRYPSPAEMDRTPDDMKPEPYCVGWQ